MMFERNENNTIEFLARPRTGPHAVMYQGDYDVIGLNFQALRILESHHSVEKLFLTFTRDDMRWFYSQLTDDLKVSHYRLPLREVGFRKIRISHFAGTEITVESYLQGKRLFLKED